MTLSVPKALTWIGCVIAAVALAILIFESGGGSQYTVYARVADAGDLLPNNFVKIDGIEAGTIKNVYLNKAENTATVKMVLDKSAAPIGVGASAAIRPVNLLGEKYLDLNPGNLKKPLPSGAIIPESRTSIPVELDDVLNTLDPTTLTALQVIINEAGISLAGRGTDFMKTLQELPPTLSAAKQVVGEVAQQNQALRTAIVDGNQVLASVDSRKNDLSHLVSTGQQALASINASRVNLGSTLDTAPAALGQLRTSLVSLQQAAGTLTPAAAQLHQATPQLASTLEQLPAFSTSADATLQEARSVAPAINRLATGSLSTLKQLRPTTADLSQFATNLKPLLTSLDQNQGLNAVLGFVNGWANVTKGGDNLGHVFNLRLSLDPAAAQNVIKDYESLLGLKAAAKTPSHSGTHTAPVRVSTHAPNPVSNLTHGLASGVASTLNGVTHTLSSTAASTLGAVGGTVSGVVHSLTGGGSAAHTSTTSSSTSSVSSLLNYLLGR